MCTSRDHRHANDIRQCVHAPSVVILVVGIAHVVLYAAISMPWLQLQISRMVIYLDDLRKRIQQPSEVCALLLLCAFIASLR